MKLIVLTLVTHFLYLYLYILFFYTLDIPITPPIMCSDLHTVWEKQALPNVAMFLTVSGLFVFLPNYFLHLILLF